MILELIAIFAAKTVKDGSLKFPFFSFFLSYHFYFIILSFCLTLFLLFRLIFRIFIRIIRISFSIRILFVLLNKEDYIYATPSTIFLITFYKKKLLLQMLVSVLTQRIFFSIYTDKRIILCLSFLKR